MEDVRREMGLEREDLIALAFFLGSDYCQGVKGVGIVNALEILRGHSQFFTHSPCIFSDFCCN